jgi:hypothetical protein
MLSPAATAVKGSSRSNPSAIGSDWALSCIGEIGVNAGSAVHPRGRSSTSLVGGTCSSDNGHKSSCSPRLLSMDRAPLSQALPVDGVRVFGYLGRFLLVRDNLVDSYTIGIQVTPRGTIPKNVVWRVLDNAILTPSQAPVQASPPVVKIPNFP